MARSAATMRQSGLLTVLCCLAAVATLYFAKDILLPLALAILLAFLLAPFVTRLERWKVPRLLAVLLVVVVSFSGLGILSSVVVHELYDVANRLPDYKANIANKVNAFRGEGGGVFKKITDSLADALQAPIPNADSSPDQGLTAQPGPDD